MRISPLPAEEWDDRTRYAVKALVPRQRQNPQGAGPAISTLARHPDLVEAYLGLGVYVMMRSTLEPRIRELVVLRVAQRHSCAYIWVSHVRASTDAGLSAAEIEGVQHGTLPDPFEQILLDTVDELEENYDLSERTWAALSERLDERQRMDLVFTIGHYGMLAMAYNTFGVMPDPQEIPETR
ncbi:carboxymuconolactone decarboxylase family protein [Nocardia sp. CA2R105]|uniref:carboxymuconolactone decarboxylase family protein n=1 Tax=Nocardia coffeae TaxID=2873381 RepID=UPI001CA76574|nr:carboxymuconolactone decarboxylase family protein [Nocardia coffeae]MBY8862306.1 carboxymuconolactone decarboxylase family protein [Nocardia coffeae]